MLDEIVLLDPSLASDNLGDAVIAEAAEALLQRWGYRIVLRMPTHRPPSRRDLSVLQRYPDSPIVTGGSNLIGADWYMLRQWRLTPCLAREMQGRLVIWGAGWQMDRGKPKKYMKWLFDRLLREGLHLARDSFSATRVGQLAPDREVVVGGCPTLAYWRGAPLAKGRACVVTITDYDRAPIRERRWLRAVRRLYPYVVLWPQGEGDVEYARSAGLFDFVDQLLPRRIDALVDCVERGADYVGTRLHGGIRAAWNGSFVLLIPIDMRMRSLCSDFRLPSFLPLPHGANWDRQLEDRLADRAPRLVFDLGYLRAQTHVALS